MKTWNVLTGVVQLIEAETAEDARRLADERVQAAVNYFGDVYALDTPSACTSNLVFESEPIA